jgi:hypothetical protein
MVQMANLIVGDGPGLLNAENRWTWCLLDWCSPHKLCFVKFHCSSPNPLVLLWWCALVINSAGDSPAALHGLCFDYEYNLIESECMVTSDSRDRWRMKHVPFKLVKLYMLQIWILNPCAIGHAEQLLVKVGYSLTPWPVRPVQIPVISGKRYRSRLAYGRLGRRLRHPASGETIPCLLHCTKTRRRGMWRIWISTEGMWRMLRNGGDCFASWANWKSGGDCRPLRMACSERGIAHCGSIIHNIPVFHTWFIFCYGKYLLRAV